MKPLKRGPPRSRLPLPGTRTALIDGDVVRYMAAAVSDGTHYEHPHDVALHQRYKKDAVEDCVGFGLDPELLVKVTTPEPIEFCLHTIKQMIHSIMDGCKAEVARLFLTGAGNYRETVATRFPYKGERSPDKPHHFDAAGKYLLETFRAEVIDGKEADDALGYECLRDPENTIVCSTDKDLLMIPGQHYVWSATGKPQKYFDYPTNKLFEVDQHHADLFFYMQLLTGDKSVDNIHGLKGIGPKKALALLEEGKDTVDWYDICVDTYKQHGLTYDDLVENAHLLWIQREEDVRWTPPTKS